MAVVECCSLKVDTTFIVGSYGYSKAEVKCTTGQDLKYVPSWIQMMDFRTMNDIEQQEIPNSKI